VLRTWSGENRESGAKQRKKGGKIADVLNLLISMSKSKIAIKEDPARMRPSDVEVLIGDSSKFRKETGWKPEIAFEQTMKDLLNYWRSKV
jgi:GDP-4-dehydro-6-deoxy-D-mannose reductase